MKGKSGHSDLAADKRIVSKAIGQHDTQLHGGKRTKLALRHGGQVHGGKAAARLDKRARGGRTKPTVNIVIKGAEKAQQSDAMKKGIDIGAMLGAKAAASRQGPAAPPMPGGPAGGPPGAMGGMGGPRPPMGPPPGMRPPGMQRGGGIKPGKMSVPPAIKPSAAQARRASGGPIRTGAGGAQARLDKAKAY